LEFVGTGIGDEKNISKEFPGDERLPLLECTDPNVGLIIVRLLPNSTVSDEETLSSAEDF